MHWPLKILSNWASCTGQVDLNLKIKKGEIEHAIGLKNEHDMEVVLPIEN